MINYKDEISFLSSDAFSKNPPIAFYYDTNFNTQAISDPLR